MTANTRDSNQKIFAFDSTKGESHHPHSEYKHFYRLLRLHHQVTINQNEISNHDAISQYDVIIFGSPKHSFDKNEFECLHNFLQRGGSLLFLLSDDIDENTISNLNQFFEKYGITLETESVVRTSHYKYFHPKEVFISNGVLHSDILNSRKGLSNDIKGGSDAFNGELSPNIKSNSLKNKLLKESYPFVYPNGLTMNVGPPSVEVLSSGPVSFPVNRPIAAAWKDTKPVTLSTSEKCGRLLVIGSADMFSDDWIHKERNKELFDVLISKFLLHDENVRLERSQVVDGCVIDEPKSIPDIEALSERLKCSLQESNPLPQDLNELFCEDMVEFSTSLLPEVTELYSVLNVKDQPLSLIPPEFECPIPSLKLATFAPRLKEQPPPALDQFDLDEEFSDRLLRLTHIRKRCNNDDLNYFIEEAGNLFDIKYKHSTEYGAKQILYEITQRMIMSKNKI